MKNQPAISDAVYGKLFQRLEGLEAAFPELQTDTFPAKRGGAAPQSKLDKLPIEWGDAPFADPRTAAAGAMRQLDSRKVTEKYRIHLIYHQVRSD